MNVQETAFIDIDGNAIKTRTTSLLERIRDKKEFEFPGHHIDQNPREFSGEGAIYQNRNKSYALTTKNFHDYSYYEEHKGPDGFLEDVKMAIDTGDILPSGEFMIEKIIKAETINIITGRPHGAENLERFLYLFFVRCLNPQQQKEFLEKVCENHKLGSKYSIPDIKRRYFTEQCAYYGCGNAHLKKLLGLKGSTAKKKTQVMNSHLLRNSEITGKLGFSDDTVVNITEMYKFFHNLIIAGRTDIKPSLFYSGNNEGLEKFEGILGGYEGYGGYETQNNGLRKIQIKVQN